MTDENIQTELISQIPEKPIIEKGQEKRKVRKQEFTQLDKLMITDQKLPDSVEELEDLLVGENFDVTRNDFRESIAKREEVIDKKYTGKQKERPKSYFTMRNIMLASQDMVAMFFNMSFVILGGIGVVILLLVSEYHSVHLGFKFITTDTLTQWAIPALIVLSYFRIEWETASISVKEGKPINYIFSLAKIKRAILRRLRFNSNNEDLIKQENTALNRASSSRKYLILVIVIFGVLGRGDIIFSNKIVEGKIWYETLQLMFTQSTIIEMMALIGAIVTPIVLISVTHFIISNYQKLHVNAVGLEEINFFDSSLVEQEKREMYQKLLTHKLMNMWESKKQSTLDQYYTQNQPQQPLQVQPNKE